MPSATIHRSLEDRVRQYVLQVLPPGECDDLRTIPLRDLLTTFFNWQGRLIPARPRACHVSVEMQASSEFARHRAAVENIIAMIESGADLIPHLSKKAKIAHASGADSKAPGERADRDLLLGEWGVHHLHLAERHARNLVYAMFTTTTAYLIGVYDHRSWGLTEVLRIVVANWPDAGLMLETTAIGLSQDFSDNDRLQLRKNGINTPGVVVNNKLWVPSALGIAADGTAMRAATRAMDFIWRLRAWEDEPDARLAEASLRIDEAAGHKVAGEWTALVDDHGTLGLLKGGAFCPLLSLAPSI